MAHSRLHAPVYLEPTFASELTNKLITRDSIAELTSVERRLVSAEINQRITGITVELDLAKARANMSPTHVSYAEYPLDWANKTKYMRENLFLLVDLLRGYEKERQPTVNELEALRIIRRMRRRFHRQRWHIAHFLDLVEEEIGEERVRELLLESSDTAERMATAAVERETLGVDLPDDPFWV